MCVCCRSICPSHPGSSVASCGPQGSRGEGAPAEASPAPPSCHQFAAPAAARRRPPRTCCCGRANRPRSLEPAPGRSSPTALSRVVLRPPATKRCQQESLVCVAHVPTSAATASSASHSWLLPAVAAARSRTHGRSGRAHSSKKHAGSCWLICTFAFLPAPSKLGTPEV